MIIDNEIVLTFTTDRGQAHNQGRHSSNSLMILKMPFFDRTTPISVSSKCEPMTGLRKFITQLRSCKCFEDEQKVINGELGKIRSTFKRGLVSGYDKKKCVCKLVFMFLCGRKLDLGRLEALNLISSNVYTEKAVGYLFISLMFHSKSDYNDLFFQCVKSDLQSGNSNFIDLALQCVANLSTQEMVDYFLPIVRDIIGSNASESVEKSAILCFLKLSRISNELLRSFDFMEKMAALLGSENVGLATCAAALVAEWTRDGWQTNKRAVIRIAVSELWRILSSTRRGLKGYSYHNFPAPWMIINLLRILRNYDSPDEPAVNKMLYDSLTNILDRSEQLPSLSEGTEDVHLLNIKYAVFLEATPVIAKNPDETLISRLRVMFEWLLSQGNPNLWHLTLEALGRLAVFPSCSDSVKPFIKRANVFLKGVTDVSVQHSAVRFLYNACDTKNVDEIVDDLFSYLTNSDQNLRGSITSRIAVITEQLLPDYRWFVDVLFKLIDIAGDAVNEIVCHRLFQVVLVHQEVQKQAAKTAFEFLSKPHCAEQLIRLAGLILGEFGQLINDETTPAISQWRLIKSKFPYCETYTRAILLTAFVKLGYKFPALLPEARQILKINSVSPEAEIQQRAVEFKKLLDLQNEHIQSLVFQQIPAVGEMPLKSSRRTHELISTCDRGDMR